MFITVCLITMKKNRYAPAIIAPESRRTFNALFSHPDMLDIMKDWTLVSASMTRNTNSTMCTGLFHMPTSVFAAFFSALLLVPATSLMAFYSLL